MFFFKIAIIQLVALIAPGPDFFFVVQTAISQSKKQAIYAVFGIVLGCTVWCILALLGLNSLLKSYHWVATAISLAGALYLAWLGYLMIKFSYSNANINDQTSNITNYPSKQTWGFLWKGLFTNLSNPKAVIYFASVLALAVTQITSLLTSSLLIGLICFETLLWFSFVAVIFSSPPVRKKYLHCSKTINLASGLIFLFFASLLFYNGWFNS